MQRRPGDVADMVEAELRAEQERAETTTPSEPPISDLGRVPDVEVEPLPKGPALQSARPPVAKEEVVIKSMDPRAEIDDDAWADDAPPTPRAPDLDAPTAPPPPGYSPKTEPPIVE